MAATVRNGAAAMIDEDDTPPPPEDDNDRTVMMPLPVVPAAKPQAPAEVAAEPDAPPVEDPLPALDLPEVDEQDGAIVPPIEASADTDDEDDDPWGDLESLQETTDKGAPEPVIDEVPAPEEEPETIADPDIVEDVAPASPFEGKSDDGQPDPGASPSEGPPPAAPSAREEIPDDVSAFGYLSLLRVLERRAQGKPRIGRSRRTRDEIARMGQDPFLAFPDSDLSAVDVSKSPPVVRPRFLGFFGPFGALPLNTTEEVFRWTETGDRAFVEFTDIFATRFLQLFYRAWADTRSITQFDHADDDRFQKYLLTFAGLGTPAYRNQSPFPDTLRLGYSGLSTGRVKSPTRLRQMLEKLLKTDIRVEEMVPGWMEFEPDGLARLGMQGSTLGQDIHLGSRIQSIGEKIRLHIRTRTLDAYRRFLPGGPDHAHLEMMVLSYLGVAFEVDVAVWLPQSQVEPAKLGTSVQLGWMACVAPPGGSDALVQGTNYRLDLEHHADAGEEAQAA
ncbi:type VI secretion system baseplate subunit TssG [Loktanella sp. IMCC34160]|uniref:type VI secretion system baseplate subunit TssG n=1 Tax=Loktanella sp. IMCC34160 TaxID=2510646 RepID=UPI0013EC7EE1|nr:type VI secretion system baseplate subunit TssG [Loktanella sp. IMCC34160]